MPKENSEYFEIKNFSKYQHYKNRNPPWVKLYYDLLDDDAFIELSPEHRAYYMMLLLLGSRDLNHIKHDPKTLQKKMRLDHEPDLTPLFNAGLLLARPARRARRKLEFCGANSPSETPTETPTESPTESPTETDSAHDNGRIRVTPDWLVQRFNMIEGLQPTKVLVGGARKTVEARIREHPFQDWWETLISEFIERSAFLTGQEKNWAASLTWICGPKNLSKILAGNYQTRGSLAFTQKEQKTVDAGRQVIEELQHGTT